MENQISFTLSAEEQNQVDQAMDALKNCTGTKANQFVAPGTKYKARKIGFCQCLNG
ncbi:hypothetical protein [Labilibaculum euxinus]